MIQAVLFTLHLVIGWIFYCRSSRKLNKDHKGQKDAKEVRRFMRTFQAPIIFFWPLWLGWALWVKYLPCYFRWKEKLKRQQ